MTHLDVARKGLLTVEQVAELTGWKAATIRQKTWRRELEFIKIGRSIRFEPAMVDALIERGRVPAIDR